MKGIANIISKYRKQKKLTQPQLADLLAKSSSLRVTNRAVSSWEQGTTEPNATVFMHLCKVLEIPDCVEEFFGNNPADPMAELNDKGKEMGRQALAVIAKVDEYRKTPGELNITEPGFPVSTHQDASGKIIDLSHYDFSHGIREDEEDDTLPLYEARASAGTGEYMDSNNYSLIPVSREIRRHVDFAVTIHGDSMEPEFHDHQTVYVHSQPVVDNGEIGLFYLDGMAYIKKYQENEDGVFLISLNKKYEPIRVSEGSIESGSFRPFGKVYQF